MYLKLPNNNEDIVLNKYQLHIGIPTLNGFDPKRGIGRTIHALINQWTSWGHDPVSIKVKQVRLPILRNVSFGLQDLPGNINLLFIPNITLADVLYFVPAQLTSVGLLFDLGTLDCKEDRSHSSLFTQLHFRYCLASARRLKHLVTISDFTLQRLTKYAPGLVCKSSTIYLGVNHHIFYPQDRQAARSIIRNSGVDIQPEDFIIIYVGEEYPRKNISTLIEVIRLLKNQNSRVKLLKIGRAHEPTTRQKTLQIIQEAGLVVNQDIYIIEDIDDKQLSLLYACADIFLSTSKYEGFCLPLLEALACGLPAVVSRAGSLPEIGQNAALYANPDNPIEFTRLCLDISKTENNRVNNRGIQRAQEFDEEITAKRLLDIIIQSLGW